MLGGCFGLEAALVAAEEEAGEEGEHASEGDGEAAAGAAAVGEAREGDVGFYEADDEEEAEPAEDDC